LTSRGVWSWASVLVQGALLQSVLLPYGGTQCTAMASPATAGGDGDEFVWPPDDLVMPLDLKNFDALVGNGSIWLVEFYAPWCAKQHEASCRRSACALAAR
jgi:hypothetical protein